ncbi:hypothetical protein ACU4GD_06925 [Cupriavidus basilensis]
MLPHELITQIPRRHLRQAQGRALYLFPASSTCRCIPIQDDQDLHLRQLLQEESKVLLLVQGTGFNWGNAPDHFRIVFLPHEDDLREAIGRVRPLPRSGTVKLPLAIAAA